MSPAAIASGQRDPAATGRPAVTYDALNAARGIAALCVMLFHAPLNGTRSIAPSGYLAVDFFFGLSGFIIAHAYDGRLAAGLDLRRFVRMRIVRFYPAYALGLAVAGLVAAGVIVKQPTSAGAIIGSLALTAAFLPSPVTSYSGGLLFPVNGPAWSLSVELVVNILYAALHRYMNTAVLAGWAIIGFVGVALAASSGAELGGPYWTGWWTGYARAFLAFPIGVLIYRFGPRPPAALLPPAMAALAVSLIYRPPAADPVYDLGIVTFLYPLLIVLLTATTPDFMKPVCRYLGRTSYPLYAIHVPVFMACSGLARAVSLPLAGLAVIAIVVLLGSCWYIDWVDERLRRREFALNPLRSR